MVMDDCFHLRVFLFREVFLRQPASLTLVGLPCALGVHGEERRHLLYLAAPARRTPPLHSLSRMCRNHKLLEPVATHITHVFVDRHARHRCRRRARLAWTLVLLLAPAMLSAQSADKKNPLADIRMLKCTFPVSATGSWKDWTPKGEIKSGPDVTLVIDEIDVDSGTARIGTTHTTALLTQNSVHFMERTMAGSLTMTTVLAQKSPKGTLRAVRSRHDYLQMAIPGYVAEPNVSQHYGECEPVE
jgi:hypothetical protein